MVLSIVDSQVIEMIQFPPRAERLRTDRVGREDRCGHLRELRSHGV